MVILIKDMNWVDKVVRLIYEDESLDFVFTSPYFGWEAYGDEQEQSSIKFDTSESGKLLRKTIENAHKGLKTGKFLALNVQILNNIKHLKKTQLNLQLNLVLNIQTLGGYLYQHNKVK